MKGYIYTMFKGADPASGWQMTDPIFGPVPTLGACMPNIRRAVTLGDHIFVVSGRVEGTRQYIVGGFEVEEKIDALAAYHRFPENRQHRRSDGTVGGNIIITPDGGHSSLDYHQNFERRIENYVIGKNSLHLETASEVMRGRDETVDVLSEIFDRGGNTPSEIIGRWRKLDGTQITELRDWLTSLKRTNIR
jgi:hypothetical protein